MLPWDEPCLSDPEYEAFRENRGRFEVSGWSEDLHELFAGMLHWDPQKRMTIYQVQVGWLLKKLGSSHWFFPSFSLPFSVAFTMLFRRVSIR